MPRFSSRELLLLVAFVAFAIASLKYASEIWQIAVTMLVLFVLIGAVITAKFDRGIRQAIATGMVIAIAIYGGLIVLVEFAAFTGGRTTRYTRFPTNRILEYLYAGIQKTVWIDRNTGEVIPAEERKSRAFARPPRRADVPNLEEFMTIGHAWWALLLGYLGGRLARFVYLRRTGRAAA